MKCKHCGNEIEPVIITTGEEFEQYLCDELNSVEGLVAQKTKMTGDQGADLIVSVGGRLFAIQCKLWSYPVGNDAVQEVIAGKVYYGCDAALVVTNSTYTDSARDLAKVADVELLHFSELLSFFERIRGLDTVAPRAEGEVDKVAELEVLFVDQAIRGGLDRISLGELAEKLKTLCEAVSGADRQMMGASASFAYRSLGIAFYKLKQMLCEGGFGIPLQNAISVCEREYHKVRLTSDLNEQIQNFMVAWFHLAEVKKNLDRLAFYDGKLRLHGPLPRNSFRGEACKLVSVANEDVDGQARQCGVLQHEAKEFLSSVFEAKLKPLWNAAAEKVRLDSNRTP